MVLVHSSGSDNNTEMYQKNTTIALLHAAIQEAAYEGRLIKGLADCSEVLQSNPDDLVICVLPETSSSSSATLGIQTILIESLCLECGIPVVRVDMKENNVPLRCHSLEREFTDLQMKWEQDDDSSPVLQLDCLFIQKSEGGQGTCEKNLMSLLLGVENDGQANFPE